MRVHDIRPTQHGYANQLVNPKTLTLNLRDSTLRSWSSLKGTASQGMVEKYSCSTCTRAGTAGLAVSVA
jgi:hypothetical protein